MTLEKENNMTDSLLPWYFTRWIHILQKDHIHPICFAIALKWLWIGEIPTVCCFETRCIIHKHKQTERKSHLLPVINPIKLVETLFQIIAYLSHQLSVVHWVMSDQLHKHQCCLLSLNRSDAVWSSVALLTPCPWETRWTSLPTMVD